MAVVLKFIGCPEGFGALCAPARFAACTAAVAKESAGVAQLVEHLICNQGVRGSNPFASSREHKFARAEGARVWRKISRSAARGFFKRNTLLSRNFSRHAIFVCGRMLAHFLAVSVIAVPRRTLRADRDPDRDVRLERMAR